MDFLNTHLLPHRDNIHNVEHNIKLVESITDIPRSEAAQWTPELRLITTQEDRRNAQEYIKQERLEGERCVGLHVSSSRAKHMQRKCWPKEHFLELVRTLSRKHPDLRFLLFCGEEDFEESKWLAENSPGLHIAMQLPIRTAAEVIRACSIFIANDSGILHLACTVNTPAVAIFGPTNPK